MVQFNVLCIAFTCNFLLVTCKTLNDTKTLLANLLADYNVNVRPVANQDDTLNVSAEMYIKSIQEFDEVKGMFSFVGALMVTWMDVNMQWDPALYGGVNQATVSYKDVWIPEFILSSPSDDVESLGKSWNRIRFYYTGAAIWMPADLIKSTCSVNVKHYPFDTQVCVTSFNCLGYNGDEIRLVSLSDTINTEIYQENSLWDIKKTRTSVMATEAGSQIDLTFYLKRKPSFVIINVLLPILFLSLLNILVFLLVPESGERVSYCITVLLSIAVFMTIVSDMLPKSSEPVPNISYKLMIDVVSSSLIVLVTIANLRIYSKDIHEPIPEWLRKLYICLSCSCFRCRKSNGIDEITRVYPYEEKKSISNDKPPVATVKAVPGNKQLTTADDKYDIDITWKKISFMIDWISFVGFTLAAIISFAAFIAVNALSSN